MGWNDREPYFSAIQSLVDEGADYMDAVRSVADRMMDERTLKRWLEENGQVNE